MIALSWLAGSPALAADPSPAWNDLLAIEGHLGVGTPVGVAGMAVDLTPHPQVSFNVGAGQGIYALQLAAMARVRPFFIRPGLAPGIGAGVSNGDTGTWELMDFRSLRFQQATWLNGELFLEIRRGRFHLRPYVGVAHRVRHSGCTYIDTMTDPDTSQPCSEIEPGMIAMLDHWRTIYYTGVAIGFGLL